MAQAAEHLGQQVLLRHFLVTVRGRTGYLEPQWEECSIDGKISLVRATLQFVAERGKFWRA